MKIAKYIILELLIIVLSLLWGTMMTNDHQSGEICITPAWGAQIQNYLEFGWNNYFHWFRKDEQAPCRYETFTIICFYILAVPLYTGLKIYGKNYLRYTNAGSPSSPRGTFTFPWISGRA